MMGFLEFLTELYGEPDGGTFTHEGHDYNLNAILNASVGYPVYQVPVSQLSWVLKYDPMRARDQERIRKADLNAPCLIIRDKDKWVVIDGIHRLAKAIKDGVQTLPCVKVTQELIDRYRVS